MRILQTIETTKDKDALLKASSVDECVAISKKRDVYALGITFSEVLNVLKNNPFFFEQQEYNEINDLLLAMKDSDYTTRPTASEAFKQMKAILEKVHPDIVAKYESKTRV